MGLLVWYHLALSLLYAFTAIGVAAESLNGFRTQQPPPSPKPLTAALVVAYLPAEAHIILESLWAIYYTGSFDQIILAYNTPEPLLLECKLRSMPWLDAVRVPSSRSKAENLNHVLDQRIINCPIVAIFDADHRPDKSAPAFAADWLAAGYAAVQGRCVIANSGQLPWLVRAEFTHIYRLLHQSRFNILGTGIFGGSNCYWSVEVLQRFRFDPDRMTEDIDLSLRVIESGYAIAHDPRIISHEVAPETLGQLWKQRTRWAQGWLEVTVGNVHRLLRSPRLTWWQKAYWVWSMYYREVFTYLSLSVYLLLAWYWVAPPHLALWQEAVFTGSSVVVIASLAVVVAALRAADKDAAAVGYGVASFPFVAFKGLVHLNALGRWLVGNRRWEVTRKG
ncbi:MAG: glycosyltransferase family 2 protein [Cyanobacteria bacterium J06554_6]